MRLAVLVLLCLGLSACSNQPTPAASLPAVSTEQQLRLEQVYQQWQGTPYRLGGTTTAGVDCSAFSQQMYASALSYQLPRTTSEQRKQGQRVAYANRQAGDLVFFKTSSKTLHVGVLRDSSHFYHASTSRGVMVSRLDNPYWQSVLLEIRRI